MKDSLQGIGYRLKHFHAQSNFLLTAIDSWRRQVTVLIAQFFWIIDQQIVNLCFLNIKLSGCLIEELDELQKLNFSWGWFSHELSYSEIKPNLT